MLRNLFLSFSRALRPSPPIRRQQRRRRRPDRDSAALLSPAQVASHAQVRHCTGRAHSSRRRRLAGGNSSTSGATLAASVYVPPLGPAAAALVATSRERPAYYSPPSAEQRDEQSFQLGSWRKFQVARQLQPLHFALLRLPLPPPALMFLILRGHSPPAGCSATRPASRRVGCDPREAAGRVLANRAELPFDSGCRSIRSGSSSSRSRGAPEPSFYWPARRQ